MRRSNVLNFPGGSSHPGDFSVKLFAVIFHLFLATMLTVFMPLSDGGLGLLIVLGLLYNLFIRRRLQSSGYFKRNALLIGILLLLVLLVYRFSAVLVLILCGLYWLMVGRSRYEAPYFLRFHVLTGLILNFFILMPYLLLNAVVMFGVALAKLAHVSLLIAPGLLVYQTTVPLVMLGIFWAAAVWLSISVLMGRTPSVGLVTDNVRAWA